MQVDKLEVDIRIKIGTVIFFIEFLGSLVKGISKTQRVTKGLKIQIQHFKDLGG